MSQKFAAGYNIIGITDLGENRWEVEGQVYDYSYAGYTSVDVLVDDVFVDDNQMLGTTNRWRIYEIVSSTPIPTLICRVYWDDEGTSDPSGPAIGLAGISRPSTLRRIMEIPTQAFAGISENLQFKLQSIDSRRNIDHFFLRDIQIIDDTFIMSVDDLNCGFVMNSAGNKNVYLPTVNENHVRSVVWVSKAGVGNLSIIAADNDTIMDSGAGGKIECRDNDISDPNILLVLSSETKWSIVSPVGTWITTD
jgi:hypothetical protein